MKKLFILSLLNVFTFINAQTINFNGCHPVFDNQNFVFTQSGVDGTGRKIYITTPVDGQSCSGLGTCEFKLQWSTVSSRWEFLADEGNGTFTTPNLIYSNTSASLPSPPSLSLGTWIENTSFTTGSCGGTLTSSNSVFTGDVQNTLLSNAKFAIDYSIVIYPNPVSNILQIESNSDLISVEIVNLQGQNVVNKLGSNKKLDVSALQSGIYFVKIHSEKGIGNLKFIKK